MNKEIRIAPIRPLRHRWVYFNGAQWRVSNYYLTANGGHVGIFAMQGTSGRIPGMRSWLYQEK